MEIDDLLAKITDEVVISIMEENGSPLFDTTRDGRTGQKCLWFQTICHGGDSHKLCYFTETKDFYCYTCCGRMPFLDFIKRIRGAKDGEFYKKVLMYLAPKVGITESKKRKGFGINADDVLSKERMADRNIFAFREELFEADENAINLNDYHLPEYDSTILNYFDKNIFYQGWIDENISIPTMEKYGISWYEYQKYIIIPHYDIDGRLVGIRRRSLKPEDSKRKYMPLFIEGKEYDHSLSLNLYGIYNNKKAIQDSHEAVIVEAEKSVLMADTFFGQYNNVIATCGFNVSTIQMALLHNLGVSTVYLGFDKDYDEKCAEEYHKDEDTLKGYMHYLGRLESVAKRLTENDFVVYLMKDKRGELDIKDSPLDKGKKVFEHMKKDSVLVTKGDKNDIRDIDYKLRAIG